MKELEPMLEQLTTTNERPATEPQPTVVSEENSLRAQAVRQVQRAHAFKLQAAASVIGMLLLTCIWATSEYNNSGGWPHHFGQSSGTPGTWNDWIIYPLIAWVVFLGFRAYATYRYRPPTEADIQREMDRMMRGR
jgi:hypothetical protein